MSLKYRDVTGKETPIAGLNGLSGELVPSVSYYQSGSVSLPALDAGASQDVTITLPTAMPDNNYVVVAYPGYPAYAFSYTPVSNTQFTISVRNVDSVAHGEGLIRWRAFKLMTDESRAIDEAAIAQNAADIADCQKYEYTKLTSTDNIDSIITPGNYGGYNGDNIGGTFPYTGNGQFTITVLKAREYVLQICRMGYSSWQRYTNSTSIDWSDWRKIMTASDLTSTVTSGSTAPITSGGVYSYINTVDTGTATKESGIGGNITYSKCGRLVTVYIDNIRSTSGDIAVGQKLAAGLPVPTLDTLFPVQCAYSGESRLFQITTGGLFYNHTYSSTLAKGAGVFGTVTYISAS